MTSPRPLAVGLLLAVFAAAPLTALDAPAPAAWLGLTPPAVGSLRGAPAEVFPLAVEEGRWQVVHFYPDHSYLFWTQNRVWQVRLDRLWAGDLLGVTMGMERSQVEAILGEPAFRGDSWSIWSLTHQTFPRRLRLVFTDGVLADAYLYRSDL